LGLTWNICLVIMDNIVIFSKTFEEHLEHLSLVFDQLRSVRMYIKPSKCTFCHTKLPYLSHIVLKVKNLFQVL